MAPVSAGSSGKVLDWILSEYNHPLSLILLVLGGGLIWSGLNGQLPFAGAECTLMGEMEKTYSLLAGTAMIVAAILIFYFPGPKKVATVQPQTLPPGIPTELQKSFLVRLGILSSTQRELLKNIEDAASITLESLAGLHSSYGTSELQYRLEQLRLLGLISVVKSEVVGQASVYKLTPQYLDAVKDPDVTRLKTEFYGSSDTQRSRQ